MLVENVRHPKRVRLTLVRIYEELRNLGFDGSYDAVRRYAASWSKATREASAEERLAVRLQKSAPKIAAFKTWLDHARTQISTKSPTGNALKYIAKYWDGLILFLTDGRIEMDSNAVERTIRPIANGWSLCTSFLSACKH
tara:strand:+ start:3234 stop:3653 length:420 start_codon:yes stop_codon:yes gene_type:complete